MRLRRLAHTFIGAVGGVRFGSRAQIDHRLGNSQLAFRRSKPFISVPGGQRLGEGLRIGKTDILGGKAHQTAGDVERIFAAIQHACKPVECSIRVRSA